MLRLDYYVSSRVHLHLENYHSEGLTPEETKACIEELQDPGSHLGTRVRCTPSGLNHNWIVHTLETMPERIQCLVLAIHSALDKLLEEKELSSSGLNSRGDLR